MEFAQRTGESLIRRIADLYKFMNAYSITLRDGGVLSESEFSRLYDALTETADIIDNNLSKQGL